MGFLLVIPVRKAKHRNANENTDLATAIENWGNACLLQNCPFVSGSVCMAPPASAEL